jgi:hypothetical protein
MRTTKTAISVMIALAVAYAVGSAYPGFMAIGALGSMERSIVDSIRSARNQIIGNLFGALLATVVVLLFNSGALPNSVLPLVTAVGIILMLVLCNQFRIQSAANLSCVVFVCLMVDITSGASLFYGIVRFLDTLTGVLIALAVNIVIRPYNHKPHIYSMIRAAKDAMIPLLGERVLRCRIPDVAALNRSVEHLQHEIDTISKEKYNSTLSHKDIAHIQGCGQLISKMQEALVCICSLDARPMPNDSNLERLYALGLERTEQDNFLDGKCTFEDRTVLNYYLKQFLDAHDYLCELLEL